MNSNDPPLYFTRPIEKLKKLSPRFTILNLNTNCEDNECFQSTNVLPDGTGRKSRNLHSVNRNHVPCDQTQPTNFSNISINESCGVLNHSAVINNCRVMKANEDDYTENSSAKDLDEEAKNLFDNTVNNDIDTDPIILDSNSGGDGEATNNTCMGLGLFPSIENLDVLDDDISVRSEFMPRYAQNSLILELSVLAIEVKTNKKFHSKQFNKTNFRAQKIILKNPLRKSEMSSRPPRILSLFDVHKFWWDLF